MSYLADYLNTLAGVEKTEVKTAVSVLLTAPSNLFDKTAATIGSFMGHDGVAGASATYDYSDFIAVTPGQRLVASHGMRFTTYYTAAKQFMTGGVNDGAFATTSIVVPVGVYFLRVTIRHVDLDAFILGEATATNASTWAGKTWATLGDSLTAANNWQAATAAALGLTVTVFGIGGTKVSGPAGDANAMCQDTRINAIPTTVDLITMMGGTNDWAQNVALGAEDSTDPLTFNGALNTFAAKAFARWPGKRIALATTPYGQIPAWESRQGWTSPAKNSLGLTTNDYAEAVRKACRRLNLPCIDVALNGGWGASNIVTAMGGSTTDNLHPATGSMAAKGLSTTHRSALRQIEPIAA